MTSSSPSVPSLPPSPNPPPPSLPSTASSFCCFPFVGTPGRVTKIKNGKTSLLLQRLPDTTTHSVPVFKSDIVYDVVYRAHEKGLIPETPFYNVRSWTLGRRVNDPVYFAPPLRHLLPWNADDVFVITMKTEDEMKQESWRVPLTHREQMVAACRREGIVPSDLVLQRFLSVASFGMLEMCRSDDEFITAYRYAEALLQDPTKLNIALTTDGLVVGDLYTMRSTAAIFYRASLRGSPRLLKVTTLRPPRVTHEADIFHSLQRWGESQTPPDPLLHLMPVELVAFNPGETFTLEQAHGLLSPVYLGTLSDYPLDVSMSELHANAAVCVERALATMHAADIVHCDVKPDNIFVDSSGECVLGGYDSSTWVDHVVERSHGWYRPAALRVYRARPMLDYATLAMTLLACLGVKVSEDKHTHTLAWIAEFGGKSPMQFIEEQGFSQVGEARLRTMVTSIERIIEVVMKCHARVVADMPPANPFGESRLG